MATVEEAFALATQHVQAGRRAVAGELCRRILEAAPGHTEALRLSKALAARSEGRPPLNVVWPRGVLDYVLESHFLHDVMLGGLERPLAVHVFAREEERPFLDDMLIVVFEGNHMNAPARARAQGCRNLGVLHLADERHSVDLGFYADADYVLRVYHFPEAMGPPPGGRCRTVEWLPNGYRTGVGPTAPERLLPMAERPMLAYFAGQISGGRPLPERQEMIEVIRSAGLPCAVIDTGRFAGGFGPVEYAAHLGRARFAPVPAGNSPETIRLYDALEQGAVPIMVRADFAVAPDALGALGPVPFPLIDSWRDLPSVLAPYRDQDDPAATAMLETLRRATLSWWSEFKAHKRARLRSIVDAAFSVESLSPPSI